MNPILRTLQPGNTEGVDAEIVAIDHVVRSEAEIEAKTDLHYIAYLKVGEIVYVDVVDADTGKEPAKGDKVRVNWTKTSEGDGMPILK